MDDFWIEIHPNLKPPTFENDELKGVSEKRLFCELEKPRSFQENSGYLALTFGHILNPKSHNSPNLWSILDFSIPKFPLNY